jgi:hypothetical protein
MPGGAPRIEPEVSDISSVTELIQYAVVAQLAWLAKHRKDVTQSKIAYAAGLATTNPKDAGSNLSHVLRDGLRPGTLQRLDEITAALAPELEHTGGLCSLALRLSAQHRDGVKGDLTAYVPPSWTGEILEQSPPGEFGVLIQGSALLSAFRAASKMDTAGTAGKNAEDIRLRYKDQIDKLVSRLIIISVSPPSARNIDAQIVLGSLASFAFGQIHEKLEDDLRKSPLGFRVWRAITKTVKLSASEHGHHTGDLQIWVAQLLGEAEELRESSLYPGRSLDLELAITVPSDWSKYPNDWVADALLARARNDKATIRERGTAAMGLWQRTVSIQEPGREKTEKALQELIRDFKDEATRPDAATGIQWVAMTLEDIIRRKVPVCNDWPKVDEDWRRHVDTAAGELDGSVPPHLLPGTKKLFEHMLLQNAGVYRRQAIETVITGGWTAPVAYALGRVLKLEEKESWLRIRALFALGYFQVRDSKVQESLTLACMHAYDNFRTEPTRAQVTEMHAALFAVGDCFGATGAEARARSVRDSLGSILRDLADPARTRSKDLYPAARAAAYLLTVCAQDRKSKEKDLSHELLERLKGHDDPVTSRLAQWALSFRFAANGKVSPLLEAADRGTRFPTAPLIHR